MGRWSAERWIPVLAILLAMQVGAAVALAVRADRLGAAPPLSQLIDADLKSIDQLALGGPAGGGETPGAAAAPPAPAALGPHRGAPETARPLPAPAPAPPGRARLRHPSAPHTTPPHGT